MSWISLIANIGTPRKDLDATMMKRCFTGKKNVKHFLGTSKVNSGENVWGNYSFPYAAAVFGAPNQSAGTRKEQKRPDMPCMSGRSV
jgi:hypothetical protein